MAIDQATRDLICERIAGDESVRAILRDLGVNRSTLYRLADSDADFGTKYARAMQDRADAIHESMSELEELVLTNETKPDAARVVLWSRQWRAAKLNPKRYGDKLEHSGRIATTREMSDAELAAIVSSGKVSSGGTEADGMPEISG
jgi:hypothetical protein